MRRERKICSRKLQNYLIFVSDSCMSENSYWISSRASSFVISFRYSTFMMSFCSFTYMFSFCITTSLLEKWLINCLDQIYRFESQSRSRASTLSKHVPKCTVWGCTIDTERTNLVSTPRAANAEFLILEPWIHEQHL